MKVFHGFAAAVALLMASGAAAEAGSITVAVADGESGTREAVQEASEAELRKLGWKLASVGVDAQIVVGCLANKDEACLRELFAETRAELLILLEVRRTTDDKKEPMVAITGRLFDGRTARFLQMEERFCQRCKDLARLPRLVGELTASLMARHAGEQAPDTSLEISTVPPLVNVVIDGTLVGPSGRSYPVTPGTHTIGLEKDGYERATRQVTVGADQTKTIRVELVPLPGTGASTTHKSPRFRTLKWVALGAGVAMSTLGVTWIAVDGRNAVQDGERQPQNPATQTPGIIASGLGVTLLVTSYLMWRADRKQLAEEAPVVTTVLVDGGAVFAVGGRF